MTIKEGRNNYIDYLGDGVYVSFDGYQIWLSLKDDRDQDYCRIALESHVLVALDDYRKKLEKELGVHL